MPLVAGLNGTASFFPCVVVGNNVGVDVAVAVPFLDAPLKQIAQVWDRTRGAGAVIYDEATAAEIKTKRNQPLGSGRKRLAIKSWTNIGTSQLINLLIRLVNISGKKCLVK